MLAASVKDVDKLDFSKGYLCTQKLDGIRALMIDGHLVSRSFKPIRNNHIRTLLESVLPDGADGEIVVPGSFQETTSKVMRADGKPEFIYYMFDYVKDDLNKPYAERMQDLVQWMVDKGPIASEALSKIYLLIPTLIKSKQQLLTYEEICLKKGFEGVIIRTPNSPYKCGRSTLKQEWLLKLKRFADDEAIIVDFTEKLRNNNVKQKDAFGHTVRSSHKENKVPTGTLGSLVVVDKKSKVKFEIGTGFDDELRQKIWNNKSTWKGLTIKYKHFAICGEKDKPRFPVFLGVRDNDDM